MSSSADDRYEQENDQISGDAPASNSADDEYVSRPGQSGGVSVQKDDAPVEDPIDAKTADSDETLKADEADAIDESNIIEERTRGAAKTGQYREPGDDEGLPSDDGTSGSS